MLTAGIAVFAAVGTLTGVLVAVVSAAPSGQLGAADAAAASKLTASSAFGLPKVRPSTGSAAVAPGLTMGTTASPLAVPTARSAAAEPNVAPLRRTIQADLLIVAPFSLPKSLTTAVDRIPGVVATERIEAVRMSVNGTSTAVLGVDPSMFREFAARPTGASNALWQGVAGGGIAVSYTMGTQDKISLGGTVTAVGQSVQKLRVAAFGTLGIGGVNAVISDETARRLGAPADNAIVVSVAPADFTAAVAAAGRLIPKGAGVEQLVSLISTGTEGAGTAGAGTAGAGTLGAGTAGAGQAEESAVPQAALDSMLKAAMSRRGMPYVWGAAGPTSFDCSGLVQWPASSCRGWRPTRR
jgi:cell wall-associated NlpC family hydrolase